MLIFANGSGNNFQADLFDAFAHFVFGQQLYFFGNFKRIAVNIEINATLDFQEAALGWMQYHQVDDLGVFQPHAAGDLEPGFAGIGFVFRDHQVEQDDAVSGPFDLRADQIALAVRISFFQTVGNVIFAVKLVDVGDLFGFAERAAADQVAGVFDTFGQVVMAKVGANRGKVIGVTRHDAISSDTALTVTGDAVAVAFGVFRGVNEETFFNRGKITANFNNLFQEGHRAFADIAGHFAQRSVHLETNHLVDAVQPSPGLLDRLDTADVVVVPGHVAAFIGGDGGLNIGTGQH